MWSYELKEKVGMWSGGLVCGFNNGRKRWGCKWRGGKLRVEVWEYGFGRYKVCCGRTEGHVLKKGTEAHGNF